MRADEISAKKLVVFDIDDTLVHTQTKVHVIDTETGEVIDSLNSHDFTHYRLKPGEEFDFSGFRNAREFFEKSKPIIPMMRQLKQDIATGNKVVMVTARADFDDRELFLDTFRKYGIDMGKVHVYRAGNIKGGTTEERKKQIIKRLLDQDDYSKAIMYDDAKPNLHTFIELKKVHPRTRFYAWHVDPEGQASEYMREGVMDEDSAGKSSLTTIIQNFVQSPIGKKYKRYDCKTVTRAFVSWAEKNNISTEVVTFAPPSAEFIKKNPQFKGKSGEGDGHIMPIVDGNAIDFTVRQFGVSRPFEDPLITPVANLRSVYGKFGYFTDSPEWFLGGKSSWIGPLNQIPAAIFNQEFGDEILEQGVAEGVTQDFFNKNFSQIDSVIKQNPKKILDLLIGMFPNAKEAIVNQYNDEEGMPFSEWRRVIYDIDDYVLSGPVVVNGSRLPIDPESEADRLAKYQQYIQDKDSGRPARYFRANDSDPRTIDFSKLPPITIAQTDRGMVVTDGNHRAFLAKMVNKPLRAYVWKRQSNNHPNVAKIKALFSNQQGVSEGIDPNTFEELDARIIARAAKQIVPTARARRTPEGYVHVTTEDGLDLYIGASVADGSISVNIGSGGGVTTSGAHKGAVTEIIRSVYDAAVRKYGDPDTPGELTIDHDAGHGVWQHIADKLGLTYAAVEVKESYRSESIPQPGPSSGAAKQFGTDAKIRTRQMTAKDIISSVPGVPYYNNVVDDWDAKDFSWNVTKKVIEYAEYLKQHPETLSKLPPAIVLNGRFEDGAHRVSALWLLQQRMDPKNPLWKNHKLNVQFVTQGVAEGKKTKRKSRRAAYGPGPFGGYGFAAGYSGDGGDGGGVGEDVDLKELNVVATLKFIKDAHGDQLYGKLPYWRHPRAVAMTGRKIFGSKFNSDAVKAAFLHDVVEDTSVDLIDLKEMGFSDRVVDAVSLLTKDASLSYSENIDRIIDNGNTIAQMVKYADNYENYTSDKSGMDQKRASAMEKKYLNSLNRLGEHLGIKYHLGEASYEGNVGMMEVAKFFRIATEAQKKLFKELLEKGKRGLAWKMIQDVTDTKLQGKEFKVDEGLQQRTIDKLTTMGMQGPYHKRDLVTISSQWRAILSDVSKGAQIMVQDPNDPRHSAWLAPEGGGRWMVGAETGYMIKSGPGALEQLKFLLRPIPKDANNGISSNMANYNVGESYTDDIDNIYAQHPQLPEGEVIQGYFNKKQRDAAALDQERQEYVKQENELQRKLKKLAAFWYHNDEDPTVEQKLKKLGWEIGQDEGYDGEPGVFVVKTGDLHGNSYISWSADDLKSINDVRSANENAAINNIDESLSDFIDSAKSKIQKLRAMLAIENAETQQMLKIYRLALAKKAAPEQIKIANDQFKDILKLVGLGGFSLLPIPGGALLIIVLEKLLNKKGMSILPSAFKPTTKIESAIPENFADGKKPGRKGLAKRVGVPTKASVSRLRQIAKSSSGEKARMAHWLANMKSGRKKK